MHQWYPLEYTVENKGGRGQLSFLNMLVNIKVFKGWATVFRKSMHMDHFLHKELPSGIKLNGH